MSRRERIKNNTVTTLAVAITDTGATSITVTDGSIFPTEGDYRIIIGSEIMVVTARASNVLTVIRAQDASPASLHDVGSFIYLLLTKGTIEKTTDDQLAHLWGMPGIPYNIPFRLLDENDAVLTASSFSWVNQGTSTITDHPSGGMTMEADSAGSTPDLRILTKSMPTAPFTVDACLVANSGGLWNGTNQSYFGIGLRESATGKMVSMALAPTFNWYVWSHTGPTEDTAQTTVSCDFIVRVWMKLNYTAGGVMNASVSHDGFNWRLFYSYAGAGAHFTAAPNQLMWFVNNQDTNYKEQVSLLAWYEF